MKIYTKTGDKGKTSLFSGERIPKNDLRIEAYGDLDELNSVLGLLAAKMANGKEKDFIYSIQSTLFRAGAWLATAPESEARVILQPFAVAESRILEKEIDRLTAEIGPLKGFILPGGSELAGLAHLARCVCRRSERHAAALPDTSKSYENTMKYLNRLSDYLFVLARFVNACMNIPDIPWTPEETGPAEGQGERE